MAEQGPTKGKIKFKIVSPLFSVVETEVDKVLLALTSGPTLILPRHAPLLAALATGKSITTSNDEETAYFISSGLVEVRRDICALCAWGIAEKDIKPDEIKTRLNTLKSHLIHSAIEKQIQDDLIHFLENTITKSCWTWFSISSNDIPKNL